MKAAAGFRNAALKGLVCICTAVSYAKLKDEVQAKQFSQDSLLKTSEVVELQAKIQRFNCHQYGAEII